VCHDAVVEPALIGRADELAQLRVLLERGGRLVLAGPAGVGKTRLAEEAARLATARGMDVERVIGSATASSLLFAATSHLVPPVAARTPHELLAAAVEALRRRADSHGLLLVVDDAHLLDPGSATLVHQAATQAAATVLATVRTTDTPFPDAVVALWADGDGRRLDVAPLDRPTVRELLETSLSGEVHVDLEGEIWQLSRGHPMYVREALLGAQAAGTIVRRDGGVWVATAPLSSSARLVDLVHSRMERLPAEVRDALETLAVAEPMTRALVDAVIDARWLDELEHRGLIEQERQGQRQLVRLAHPVYGEVLRAVLTPTRTAALAARWADAVAASQPAPGDLMRVGSMLLDAGRDPSPELALGAAREALSRFEGALAERLARVALVGASQLAAPAGIVLGVALQLRGDAAADAVLAQAADAALDEAQRTEAILARARNRHWTMGDRDGAVALLVAALDEIGDEALRGALDAELALYYAVVDDLAKAGATAEAALARRGVTPRTELNALVVLTLAHCVQGRLEALTRALPRALLLARELGAEQPLAEDQVLLNHAFLLIYDDAGAALRLSHGRVARPSPLRGVWLAAVGLAQTIQGDLGLALASQRDAVAALEQADPFANLAMVRCMQAMGAAVSGDGDRATAALQRVDPVAAGREPRTRVWHGRALAWSRALRGDLAGAVEVAVRSGEDGVAHGYLAWGASALYDAVRFGAAPEAGPSLAAIAEQADAPVLGLFADHAAALAERDAPGMQRIASSLLERGHAVAAADAFAQATTLLSPEDGGRSTALLRAAFLASRLPPARTPALRSLTVNISTRERELAQLGAQGLSNREIASKLFLSHRTVENHLARIYQRFNLAGRAELRAALDERFVRNAA
jgi:DNA-binding NarL/FixJ family response regulator